MQKKHGSQSGIFNFRIVIAVALCSLGASLGFLSFASTPPTSNVTVPSTAGVMVITWTGTIPPLTNATSDCTDLADTAAVDQHVSTINVPAGTYSAVSAQFRFNIAWTPVVNINTSDEILTVVGLGSSDGGSPSETVTGMNLPGGTYKIVACGFANAQPQDYTGTLTITTTSTSTSTPTPTPTPAPTPIPGLPRFFNYVSPFTDGAGEPSIGSNWGSEQSFSNSLRSIPNGGNSHYFGGFMSYMLHVKWDDCPSPANATFTKKPLTLASSPHVFGDPILFTDNSSNPMARTFVSQLEGLTPAGSATDITDDDGATFTPSEGSGLPSRIDHQTFGGGPFHQPVPGGGNPVYPHAIYYCSQSVADAACSLSVDGGRTFGPAITIFTTADCGGLHGHIKVAPDGTAFVPNNACGGTDLVGHTDGQQAVIVSENNGVTWSIRQIPGSTTKSDDDSSVGVALDSNTIYEGMQSADGHPRVAVSHDKGLTWSTPFDVGATVVNGGPVLNTTFPAVVAGDGGTTKGRAAFAFYGTETGGSDYDQPGFAGVWYLYVATTFDSGQTWTTQNITPGDPIQRNGICGSGTCRNLLDFFDATIDKQGRVLIGYDDGCIGPCVAGGANSFTARATIARQAGGKRMFKQPGEVEPALPEAPGVSGTADGSGIRLSWQAPDNGGATITSYKIYHKIGAGGSFTLIATVPETSYTDATFTQPASDNFYRVTAVNSQGEGPYCRDFSTGGTAIETACVEPGITVMTDATGDSTDMLPSHDAQSLQIAEPFLSVGSHKMIFTLKVRSLSTVPPNTTWPVRFTSPGGAFFVKMQTSAAGAASFAYGPGTDVTVAGTPADPASGFRTDGTIKIVVPNIGIGNPKPGDTLSGFLTQIRIEPAGVMPDNMPQNSTPGGTPYTLVGNDVGCLVNQLPTAVLTADKTSGTAPVVVTFNGSGSTDPDPGDSVAKYTFNFGDGTPDVDSTSPTVSHTYDSTHPCPGGGTCTATLTVKDQSGAQSANVATWNVTVAPSACTLPGITVLPTDPTGDELDMVAAHDVQSLQIAQPSVGAAPDKIFFTLKVASLSTVPPDTNWPVQFTSAGLVYTARMTTVPPATPAAPVFEFYQGPLNALLPTTTVADPLSTFSADGTIRIVVPRSGVGNPAIGSNLTLFLVRIQVVLGSGSSITPDNMPDSLAPSGSYTIISNNTCPPLRSVVSRKTHGTAGDFDIDLPLAGNAGIECRSGGATNAYELIYTLDRNVNVAGIATVTQGTATVGTPIIGPDLNQVTVNLTGVTNIQHLIITLNGVQGSFGALINNSVARMDVLVGDVNASRRVDSGDVSLVRQQTLQTITGSNFREDINASGRIDSGDVSIARQQTLTSLPSPP